MPSKPKEVSLAQVKAFTEKIRNDSHELGSNEEEQDLVLNQIEDSNTNILTIDNKPRASGVNKKQACNRTHELYDLAEILKTLPIENKVIEKKERGRPRHSSDLVQLNVLIPKEHRLLLQYVAEQEDLSLNQITRRAIQQYLVVNLDVLGIESEDIGVALIRDGKSKETRTNKALYKSVEQNRDSLPRLDLPAASSNINENSLFEDLNPDYK